MNVVSLKKEERLSEFAAHVLDGFSADKKYLSSRYFYDAEGDRLFQAIMASPEYYLTNCELEIFQQQGNQLAEVIAAQGPFELVELGSGDGLKTSVLIDALYSYGVEFTYRPVDISDNSLQLLAERLKQGRPWLNIDAIHGNYMHVLADAALEDPDSKGPRRVFMFLGSNLGNYRAPEAVSFLQLIHNSMRLHDSLMIGLDLQKDPAVIRAAYDDAAGHTRDFNLNLLRRINNELGANFDLDAFTHAPEYDPETGAACSYLRCTKRQSVYIKALQKSFNFEADEKIFMEISQKYSVEYIDSLVTAAGFRVDREFFDSRHYFTDQVWKPVE